MSDYHNEMSKLRETAAIAAMSGLLADHKDHEDERHMCGESGVFTETCSQAVARLAVQQADDLIRELTKPLEGIAQTNGKR